MRRRMTVLLLALLLLPCAALAELEYIRSEKKYITFPSMDEWRGHFNKVQNWTIVRPEDLDEHLELVLQRGDTEEEIRARYASPNFLFEAYSTDLPTDACFRAEVYESTMTRNVWNTKHLSSAERKELLASIEDGYVLPDRDIYSLTISGSNDSLTINGYYTNYPPTRVETGQIQFIFRNGRMYVFSYCVSGRLAGRGSLYTKKEKEQFRLTPMSLSGTSSFRNKALPRLPHFTLDEVFPGQAGLETLTVTGAVEKGSSLSVALDGAALASALDKQGRFTVDIPLNTPGDHEVTFTVTNSKFTDRIETYLVNASGNRTPLTITEQPEAYPLVGAQRIAGRTDPGALILMQLDSGAEVALTADAQGLFSHTFQVEDSALHTVRLVVSAAGKDPIVAETMFYTQYETIKDGIKAFSEKLTEHRIDTMSENPADYVGERVKISIRVRELVFNESGLGLLCEYNPPNGSRHPQTPLYVTVPGYAQCQIHDNMILTIYGTVQGERTFATESGEETRMDIFMEYGTYMTYK